jgi:hypothetical protein
MDAYRNESRRWHQLKAEVKERASSRQPKKPIQSQLNPF